MGYMAYSNNEVAEALLFENIIQSVILIKLEGSIELIAITFSPEFSVLL